LTAEEPENDFTPAIGTINTYQAPRDEWVRLDDFVYEGYEIPIYYDNMFAKLIVWGADRTEAIQRMIKACNDFKIEGVPTTLDFGRFVMQHPKFIEGDFDTNFIAQYYTPEARAEQDADINKAAALFTYLEFNEHKEVKVAEHTNSNWNKRNL